MENHDFFKKLVGNINKNKTVSASKLVNSNPAVAAVISKLVNPKAIGERNLYKSENLHSTLSTGKLDSISNSISTRYLNNKSILELFPDIELAMQILISSILSPKDMIKAELNYSSNSSALPPEINAQILTEVKKYLNSVYSLDDDMPRILEEALFMKGASVKAVLPESLIDSIINSTDIKKGSYATGNTKVSQEVMSELYSKTPDGKVSLKPMGILGPYLSDNRVTLESFTNYAHKTEDLGLYVVKGNSVTCIDTNIEISDNFKILKLPLAMEKIRSDLIKTKYGSRVSTESTYGQQHDINSILFKTTDTSTRLVEILPTSDNLGRQSVGKPLVLNLPSESVIPISLPNEPHKHLGYFAIVDENGNPVTATSTDMSYLKNMMSTTPSSSDSSVGSYLLQRASSNLNGSNARDNMTIDNITQIYTSIVEDNLKKRLMNGLYDGNVTISNDDEIYKIMLARSLANRYTKVIYIPSEFVSYFAFDYYENGVGKSLLDNLRVIASIRAVLLFAKTMAHLKSSINITTVNLKLDEHDPDPQRTIEVAMHEVLKMRQQYFPLGVNSAPDLVDWIQRAGVEFSFEGHPGLPDTKFDFDVKNLQHTIPPSDLEDDLRRQTYMSLGLPPETVDNGFDPEFATTVVANNILLTKRVLIDQNKFLKVYNGYVKKLLTYDEVIRGTLREIIENNLTTLTKYLDKANQKALSSNQKLFIDEYIDAFIGNMTVSLPKPDETVIDTQTAAFDKYVEALDKAIDFWVSSDLSSDAIVGDIGAHVESIKETARAYFIRKWMADNNFLPELSELVTSDTDGNPNFDLYDVSKSHVTGLMKSFYKYISSIKTTKDTINQHLADNDVEEDSAEDEPDEDGDLDLEDAPEDTEVDETATDVLEEDNVDSEPTEEVDSLEPADLDDLIK